MEYAEMDRCQRVPITDSYSCLSLLRALRVYRQLTTSNPTHRIQSDDP